MYFSLIVMFGCAFSKAAISPLVSPELSDVARFSVIFLSEGIVVDTAWAFGVLDDPPLGAQAATSTRPATAAVAPAPRTRGRLSLRRAVLAYDMVRLLADM